MESLEQIIMDGNGRWAQQRRLPIFQGHEAGVKSLNRVIQWCKALKIRALTVSQIHPGTGAPIFLGCPSSEVMRAAFLPLQLQTFYACLLDYSLSQYIQQFTQILCSTSCLQNVIIKRVQIFASSPECGVCFLWLAGLPVNILCDARVACWDKNEQPLTLPYLSSKRASSAL